MNLVGLKGNNITNLVDLNGNTINNYAFLSETQESFNYINQLILENVSYPHSSTGTQGIAYDKFNNYIIQYFSACTIGLINNQGIVEYDIPCNMNHGSSLKMLSNRYNSKFPLLYGFDKGAWEYEIKEDCSNTVLLRKFVFTSEAGVDLVGTVDEKNERFVTIGYSQSDVYQDPSDDNSIKMYVCTWDMNDLTLNSDGSYTPKLLNKFEVPYIHVAQACEYKENKLYVISSLYYLYPNSIYIIDLSKHTVSSMNFGSINGEMEGLSYVDDNHFILHVRHQRYYKLTKI